MNLVLSKNKKASAYYVLASLISKATVFFITPVLTHFILPEEYGVYVLFTSYLGILTVFLTLEMSGGGIYSALFSSEKKTDFIYSLFVCQFTLSLLAVLIYLSFAKLVSGYIALSQNLILLLILQIFLNSVEALYLALCRYVTKYKTVFFIGVGKSIISGALSLFFVITLGLASLGRIYAILISSLIFVLPIIAIIIKEKPHFDTRVFSYIKRTLLPLLPHYLAASVSAQSGKIVIERLCDKTALGGYGAACALALAVSV